MGTGTFEVPHYVVRRLSSRELPAVRQLFQECAAFFQLIHMEPGQEAAQLFEDVPPGKTPEDKQVFGFSRQDLPDQLVGLLEMLRSSPAPEDW